MRAAALAAAFFFGTLCAVGSVLAALFEAQGFGAPRSGPRPWYLASLLVALLASVVTPFVLLRVLVPRSGARALWYALPAAVVALVLFGLAVR
ncbi:MAG: hypothetical protein M3N52_01850 [Actinomycetota bacterium]|nr:hypothetical protein [Actinomycetota bacterium]